jgi:hypothetical protein
MLLPSAIGCGKGAAATRQNVAMMRKPARMDPLRLPATFEAPPKRCR